MNCNEIESRFSRQLEGELDEQQAREFERHLANCEACKRSFESLRYALGDLQGLQLREADEAEVGALLAAVEGAREVRPRTWRRVASHLVAAGIGGLVIWFLLPREIVREPVLEEVLVERVVEVPVETRVEVPVEVPVEVRIEVPVERLVEVPVPVERVREVAHPLQVDADRWLAWNETLTRLVARAEEQARLAAQEESPARTENPAALAEASSEREQARAPVRVVRSGERVSLRTRGPQSEVVPALIAMLRDDDPRLRRVVEERLENIRGVPGVPGAPQEAPEVRRSAVGLDDLRELIHGSSVTESEPDPDRNVLLWRTWWEQQSSALAAADSRPTY
jgi:hypothetical protein